jgi:hypothetical protein
MSFKVQNKVLNTEVPQPLVSKKEEVVVPKQNNSTITEQKFVANNNLNEGLAGKTGFDYSTLRRNSLENTFLAVNQNKKEYLPKTMVFTPQELGIITSGKKLPAQIKVGEQQFEQKLFESYGLDINNPNDKAVIQKVYGNEKEPADNLDWTINGKAVKELTATLRSDGNYEITFDLRKETNDRLSNAFFNKLFFPNQANIFDFNSTQNLSANTQTGEFQKTADDVNLTDLALDMTQMGLDIVGIFEPTPFADLTNAGISAVRGEWGNAALSVLGVIPYLGDLGKFGKIPKWLSSIEKLTTAVGKLAEVAIKGGKKGKEVAEAFIKQVKGLLDKIPFDKVPGAIRDALGKLKQKVDDFFGQAKKADDNIVKSEKIDDVGKTVDNTKTTKTDGTTSTKQPDVEPPKKPDLEKQKKLEEIKAKRADAEAQRKLQEGIKDAEKRPSYKKLPEVDKKWLESNPRHKELAYDPDTKSFKVGEAKAALEAEKKGILEGPVRRAIDENGRSQGGDLIDGKGRFWDVKDARDLDKIVESANKGENVLVDASKLSPAELKNLQDSVNKLLKTDASKVKYVN